MSRAPAFPFRHPAALPARRFLLRACAAAGLVMATTAWGQTAAPDFGTSDDSPAAMVGMARQWVQEQIPTPTEQNPNTLRPELVVGELDSRLRLTPCRKVEPFLPEGTRLWGRSRIGLRCTDGPTHWTVFLPITVKAWGPAWVIRQPVAPGATLSRDDASSAEVDWAEGVSPILARPEDWVGAQATRALMPGQTLRQGMVRPAQVFSAGSEVKVLVNGNGFSVSATGEALTNGYVGQPARVRMPSREVVTGTVRDAETVEVTR